MKRIHLLFFCLLCCGGATAQSQSLADALEALNQRQSDYEISFIHNDLEHLQVTANVSGLSIPRPSIASARTSPSASSRRGATSSCSISPRPTNAISYSQAR